jgi:hypothetical protein
LKSLEGAEVLPAAAELNDTPGAVSQGIKALEDDLGVRLFDRGHEMVVTDKGRLLISKLDIAFKEIALGVRVISNRWARWTLCKRQQSCAERGCGLIGPSLLVDRELKVGKTRKAFVRAEDPQAGDDRAGRKRGDGETRERCGAHPIQTGACIDDLPVNIGHEVPAVA